MIKVLIQRKVLPECIKEYEKRTVAVNKVVFSEVGFISSEGLANTRDPYDRWTIITFDNAHNWRQWYKSDKRCDLTAEIMQMLEEPERITILEYLAKS